MIGPRTRAGMVLLFTLAVGVVAGITLERHHLGLPEAFSEADEHAAAMAELREIVGLDDRQLEQVHADLHKVIAEAVTKKEEGDMKAANQAAARLDGFSEKVVALIDTVKAKVT